MIRNALLGLDFITVPLDALGEMKEQPSGRRTLGSGRTTTQPIQQLLSVQKFGFVNILFNNLLSYLWQKGIKVYPLASSCPNFKRTDSLFFSFLLKKKKTLGNR